MWASFLEIGNAPGTLNESLTDLFDASSSTVLTVRYDEKRSPFVHGLRRIECSSYDDCVTCMTEGAKFRRTSSTAMNARSSRSHSVFTLTVENPASNTRSKFNFVDLAGSERIKASKAEGDTLKETQAINKSLFALGQVILSLTSDKKTHVPFRDSKMTEVLADSFGTLLGFSF